MMPEAEDHFDTSYNDDVITTSEFRNKKLKFYSEISIRFKRSRL